VIEATARSTTRLRTLPAGRVEPVGWLPAVAARFKRTGWLNPPASCADPLADGFDLVGLVFEHGGEGLFECSLAVDESEIARRWDDVERPPGPASSSRSPSRIRSAKRSLGWLSSERSPVAEQRRSSPRRWTTLRR
jgi:hypothetical protein